LKVIFGTALPEELDKIIIAAIKESAAEGLKTWGKSCALLSMTKAQRRKINQSKGKKMLEDMKPKTCINRLLKRHCNDLRGKESVLKLPTKEKELMIQGG
jgi:hypothetical protein